MLNPDARIAARARDFGMAGWCVALAAPGQQHLVWGGEDWPNSGRAVTAATRFHAASTGKHLTACAVLALADAGRIDLDQPIGSLLHDVPHAWRDRTVAQLMTHTSGLPEYLAYADGETVPEAGDAFLTRYAALAPITPAGAAWGYSNTNYILLGLLIAQYSRQSYAAFVETLCRDAGAPDVCVASPDWVRGANAGGLGADAADTASMARSVIGDGDIACTPDGALQWLNMLLARGTDDRLFRPARLRNGMTVPYASGWFAEPLGPARIVHHAGHYDGWTAMAFLNLFGGDGVIALCNLAPGSTRAIRALAQAALEDFAPGTTPLSLKEMTDHRPDLTDTAYRQLLRNETPIDRDFFAPELQAAIDRGGPVRGVINLWTGVAPDRFALVDYHVEGERQWRRYRLAYADRIEHLLVETDADDKIAWAWPL